MRRRVLVGPIMAALLTACAATQPRAATMPTAVVAVVNEPTATAPSAPVLPVPSVVGSAAASAPVQVTTASTATPVAPAATVAASAARPVTTSMQQLNIAGARYAALGDPNAPLTIVEYSDFG